MCRRVVPAFVWLWILLCGYASDAGAGVRFAKDVYGCEPPSVFYSNRHLGGRPPCCATVPGRCEGLQVCPESGVCPDTGRACVPEPGPTRPNILLFIADDVGACHAGFYGECRSAQTGTPLPAPATPNLDALAGSATVFPIAHNTAAWCYPSLNSMLTGRFQRSFAGQRSALGTKFATIPRQLRALGESPDIPVDPYDPEMRVGGYCTYLGGKFTGSAGQPGFDAGDRGFGQRLGRLFCSSDGSGGVPKCGSDRAATYDPLQVVHIRELFQFVDAMIHPLPDAPGSYGVKPWFIWYAPRIPHQPLRAPVVIRDYLFGSGPAYPLGGVFNLGQFCSGASCPPSVTAFGETVFGDVRELYGNLWWMDDSVREIREYLVRMGSPHCVATNGKSRFDVATPGACGGTWAEVITPDLPRNTVIMFLADNGWHLPDSKHSFTENGHRTRLIVFDPRNLPEVPSWDVQQAVTPPPQESEALAHAVDMHATAMGFALGTAAPVLCPEKPGGGDRCDGIDLRAHLFTAPGGPADPKTLRKSMCGHQTQKPAAPTKNRYLITGPGVVGRCVDTTAQACANDAACGANGFCLEGRCAPKGDLSCTTNATCPSGSVCLGNKCRMAPPCLEDSDCGALFPGGSYACVAKEQKWCRNDPGVACSTRDDCPVCGPNQAACQRLCEPQRLKFYVNAGASIPELTDLFADPDEVGLHKGGPGDTTLVYMMSSMTGPYANAIRRANCCIDEWWSDPANLGSKCTAGYSCPAELSCVTP